MTRTTRIVIGTLASISIIASAVIIVRNRIHDHDHAHDAVIPQKPQEAGDRITVKGHGCSLRVPRGWTTMEIPSGGIMFYAPEESGYIANFIILSEPFTGELREFADTNMAGARQALPTSEFANDTDFATESGAPVFKAKISNKKRDLELAQAMYFFDGPPGRKIGVTTTALAKDKSEMQQLFDSCLKSLTVLAP